MKKAHRLQFGLLGPGDGVTRHLHGLTLFDDFAQHLIVAVLDAKAHALAAGGFHQLE